MKIIKPGVVKTGTRRFTCPRCGCIFEAEKDEYSAYRFFGETGYYTAKCPTCEEYTWSSEAVDEKEDSKE